MAEKVFFDKSLYSLDAVEAAAAAYAEHAKIAVTAAQDSVEAVISDSGEYDLATIAHAFSNHVLHETIALRRRTAIDEGA